MSSSNSPCAACKFLRRKCTQGCVFSPYFPPDQPQKFANVHRVFGASNVAKLLNEISPSHREDAVNSLAYEAEARLRDPVYGCVGYISMLQQKIKAVQHDLFAAKKELATYIGPAALGPFLPPLNSSFGGVPFLQQQQGFGHMGMSPQQQMILREQQQQIVEAQQLELLRMQQQHEINSRFNINNGGFVDGRGLINQAVGDGVSVGVSVGVGGASGSGASPPPGLALVVSPQQQFDNSFHSHQQAQQLQLHQYVEQQQMQQQHRAGSDEGRSGIGPAP